MSETSELIVASRRDVPVFTFNESAKIAKSSALERSALIAKVDGHDSKVLAVRAQQAIKQVTNSIEKQRTALKEPLLMAGRQLDTLCKTESKELLDEQDRLSRLVAEFDEQERVRVREEERLQRAELERIEREKQAEIDRLAKEQADREREAARVQQEADRAAKAAAEAAAKAEREAASIKEREAARKLQGLAAAQQRAADEEKQRQEAVLAQERAKLEQQTAQIEEKAQDAAYVAAKPPEITRVAGQMTTVDYEITKINDWALMKARPDLVRKIEFDMRAIKEELKRGVKLAGVEAKEVHKAGVRAGRLPDAIEA